MGGDRAAVPEGRPSPLARSEAQGLYTKNDEDGRGNDRQRQAAASLGAGPLRAFATVDLPVVWRPLLAAAGFAFAVSLGEFGATSFLFRDEHPTLPVVIYQLIGRPGNENFGMALAASVVLAATTAVVVLVVDRVGVRSLGTF